MSLLSRLRARPVLVALGVCITLLLVVASLAAVVVFDERRAGRVLSAILTQRLGRPIRIARVATDATRSARLTGVRVPPTGSWSADLFIQEIRLEGPLLRLLLRPGGQHVEVRVVSTSLSLAAAGAPVMLPGASALDRIREFATRLLSWPATATFALSGGELRVQDQITSFDLVGEKAADGRISLRLTARSQAGASMVLEGLGSEAGGLLVIRLTAEGDPRAFAGAWPAELPAIKGVTGVMTLELPGRSLVNLTGQVTLTPVLEASPVSLSTSASYYPEEGRLGLQALAARWGPEFTVEGSGEVRRLLASPRLELDLRGKAETSPFRASLELDMGAQIAKSVLRVDRVRLRRWLSRFGLAAQLPEDVEVESAGIDVATEIAWTPEAGLRSARVEAELDRPVVSRGRLRIAASSVELRASALPRGEEELVAESSMIARSVDARFNGELHKLAATAETRFELPRSELWRSMGIPTRLKFTLSDKEGAPILTMDGESLDERQDSRLDRKLRVSLPDLGRLPPLIARLKYDLTGSADLEARLSWSPDGRLRAQGEVALEIPSGAFPELDVNLTALRGRVPIGHHLEGTVPWGTISIRSLAAYGVTFENFAGRAQIEDGFLNLPEFRYAHYGGTGIGWVQADFADPALPIRARVEGSKVDLAQVLADFGPQAGKVSGLAAYVVGLSRTRSVGLEVGGQFRVEPPGGVVSIDVLRDLLADAPEGPLGVVRETLKGLSEFRYRSLSGELYMDQRETQVSLSLQGRKRFGIFPPKIRAITIDNLPLSRVVRILGGQTRREQ